MAAPSTNGVIAAYCEAHDLEGQFQEIVDAMLTERSEDVPRWLAEHLTAKQRAPRAPRARATAGKTLILVRHGESEHNVSNVYAYGDGGEDSRLYDAPLSAQGRAQVAALASHFEREPVELIICSPLARAVQTCVAAFPRGATAPVEMWPIAAEHLTDSCDIGSSPAELQAAFPSLRAELGALPSVWWYTDSETSRADPADSRKRYRQFGFMEPEGEFWDRVDEFARMVRARPERRIALFGHSDFLNALLERHLGVEGRWLANAEILRVELPAIASS
jgi:broad specificity phosphatase PhoE